MHCKNEIVKITNLMVSTVARNSIHFNLLFHTGCCCYMHDVTMRFGSPSIKMYTRVN